MKQDIHPTYYSNATVTCACGNQCHVLPRENNCPTDATLYSLGCVFSDYIEQKSPGMRDVYVEVTYSGYIDRVAMSMGKGFIGIDPEWVIGLNRTAAGWRIDSIGVGGM